MKKYKIDYILLGTVIILALFGILILASSSASLSYEKFGNTYYFLSHQIILGLIPGIILAFLAFRTPIAKLKRWAPILLLMNLGLMALVFMPGIGTALGGANRWINFGPISFQPSEFLKLTFVLYLAAWLSSRIEKAGLRKKSEEFSQTFFAFLIVIGLVALLLIFQPDVSTLGIIVLTAALMYFLAGTPLWHNILLVFAGTGSLFLLIRLAPYRMARFLVFLKPETDPMGIGYQVKQALITVGSGGVLGLGLGMSRQQFGFLPQSMSDSVFAIIAEETGFIGSCILILLFLTFLGRAFNMIKKTSDKFSQLAAAGISSWIILQVFVNIGAMIAILPLTGIPLPFIGYGGSHMVVELIGVGILLNISKNTS